METEGQAKRLFNEALERPEPERAAFLSGACGGDATLLARVQRLLAAHRRGSGFLASPTRGAEASAAAGQLPEPVGATIGRYTLLELIGEGGFGSVFLAEQREPVRRRVAVKVIKLGMDTRQVTARFEAERQALAMMDHPGIARVLDAGATETGRPYFVMELVVGGEPITEYCDRHKLTLPRRLELFREVCQAVQHAHQKGVIHRDIKPSNVLVAEVDGRPAPKIIDFGIAKATGGAEALTDRTLFTDFRQFLGTPEYMSPEQAQMDAVDIDTRSDIYSLGVLLYELLTGAPPFDQRRLRSAAWDEMRRIIREDEPQRPSTLLHMLADTGDVAARRGVEPSRLAGLVRGDLDWIVMKCLDKDRARRYETASGLGMDIGRHLRGEPVQAAPPGAMYRVRKFIRRHRGGVGISAAVGAAVLVGLAGTSWGVVWALAEQRRTAAAAVLAEAEAKRADDRAEELRKVADFQAGMLARLDPAEAGRLLTQDILSKVEAVLADAPEPERTAAIEEFAQHWKSINATDAARDFIDYTILRPAVATIDEDFEDQPIVDAQLRQSLASRYRSLGRYDAAMPLQMQALETRRRALGGDHPDTIVSISNMGVLLRVQGKLSEAESFYREAMEKRRRVLGQEHPDTLTSINNMGFLLRELGRLADAEFYYREALEKCRRVLGEEHPDTLTSVANMGALLRSQNKLSEAEPYYREALEKSRRVLGEDDPRTLASINNMGFLLQEKGKLAEAEPYYREALEKRRRVLGDEHPETLTSIGNMGGLLRSQDKLADAEPYYREALEKRSRVLGKEHPDTLRTMISMGALRSAQGNHLEACDLLVSAEPAARKAFSGGNTWRLAFFLTVLGRARVGLAYDPERFFLAEANLLEARSIFVIHLGDAHKDTLTCVQGIMDLYTAWNSAEPGKGYDAKAAEWKEKLKGLADPTDTPPRGDI